MGGLAPIKMEVCADSVTILESGVYAFKHEGKVIAYYPTATTIVQDIENNSQYVNPEPPVPRGDVDVDRLMNLFRDRRGGIM